MKINQENKHDLEQVLLFTTAHILAISQREVSRIQRRPTTECCFRDFENALC